MELYKEVPLTTSSPDRKDEDMKEFTGTPNEYARAYRAAIESNADIETLNTANHLALEQGLITVEQFMAAAQVLAKEILKR